MPKSSAQKLCFKKLLVLRDKCRENNNKENYVYSGYGIAFDGEGSWSFNEDTAINVIIFGINNCSLSHTDNLNFRQRRYIRY